ncbi:MAG: proline iminopeptidase, partial [Cyclobacteriaceae bacterium]
MRLLVLLLACFIFSCKQVTNDQSKPGSDYFTYGDSVESGGVKLIPIHTPVGDFKVWTKRFGSNPKIKVLLLHGGPALTHEYMECFE